MGSTILGDLNEEFVSDVRRVGARRARALYRRRAIGVVFYATRDSLCLREWTRQAAPSEGMAGADPSDLPGGLVDPRFLAVLVMGLAIGVNTVAYRMTASSLPHWFVSVVGAVSFLFLLSCAALATGMVCQAMRRRGMRSESASTLEE